MASAPIFAGTPKQGSATISSADTSYSAPATTATIMSGGTSGSRIERARVCATGTTAAGVVNLWIFDGTNYRLIRSLLVTASTTVAPWGTDGAGLVTFEGGLMIPNGYSLRISTTIAQGFHATADYGDF
jgi:hypothetical protein